MRSVVWSLISVATLALVGCNSSSDAQSGDDAAQGSVASAVTGTVALRGDAQVSAGAKLEINLVDVSQQGSSPLATKTVQPAGQFPQQFKLDIKPEQVNANDLYVVQASLVDGERHYSMPLQAPVLTKGAPAQVSIQLVGEQTEGEKELAAFKQLQSRIGGLKVSNGTKLETGVSRGWQVFRDGTEVKFIRELVDYGNKGFTSTDFAYKNGKPWVAEQQKKSSKDAKPTSVDTAGWSDAGDVVIKQHTADGKTDNSLSDDAAADLKKQSTAILGLAAGGKSK